MKKDKIIKYAEELVELTIYKHNKKILGKENMIKFIKRNIKGDVSEDEYIKILRLYNRLLAESGYEIKKDIDHFDIIDYSSEEYELYNR